MRRRVAVAAGAVALVAVVAAVAAVRLGAGSDEQPGLPAAGAPERLPVDLDFAAPAPGTAPDRQGEGTGFPAAGVSAPAGALDLAAGALTIGIPASGDERRTLVSYDGRAPHAVTARLIGPLALDEDGQEEGIVVGSAGDSVRLVARRREDRVVVAVRVAGGERDAAAVVLPRRQPDEDLTLRLAVDPGAGGAVTAAYAIGDGPPVVVGAVYRASLTGDRAVAGLVGSAGDSDVPTQMGVRSFAVSPGRLSAPGWRPLADPPIARYEGQGAVIGGRLYVMGGFEDLAVRATARSDVLDVARGRWGRIADMPRPLTHAGVAVVGRTIWIAGGFVGDNPGPSTDEVWIYDADRDRWSPGPALPAPRAGGGFVLLRGLLHYYGGGTRAQGEHVIHADHADHWVLDPAGDRTWRRAAPMPDARNHMAGVAVGGYAYAIGGQHLSEEVDGNQAAVERYDPARDRWERRAPMPIALGHITASTFPMGRSIVVVGGIGDGQAESAAVLRYDPAADRWSRLQHAPEGRQSPVAAAVGRRIVAVGGAVEFDPKRDAWVGTPSVVPDALAFGGRRTLAQGSHPGAPGYVSGLASPTTLALARDGRLYVGTLGGRIEVLRLGGGRAVHEGTITLISRRPNHGPDGHTPAAVRGRHLTGLSIGPPRADGRTTLYVSHADPRIQTGMAAGETTADPASGTVTELVGPPFTAAGMRDLVRGLPRSAEFHSVNGSAPGAGGWLYVSVGAGTNAGAPGDYFSRHPETALSAGVVRVRPARVTTPIDVSGVSRFRCEGGACTAPVGAGDGTVPGVFELYATGVRNGYDLTWHSNGSLYLNDNGPNALFGPVPGASEGCPADPPDDPGPEPDQLRRITPGGYHGHADPARRECARDRGPGSRGPYAPPIGHYGYHTSTDGIIEYHGGALDGRLLSVDYAEGASVTAVTLSADGARAVDVRPAARGLSGPVDLVETPDGGLIVAELGHGGRISLLEPSPATSAGTASRR